MITVKLDKNDRGNDELTVETDEAGGGALVELDKVFEILVGERPRRGGYISSSKFIVEIKGDSNRET